MHGARSGRMVTNPVAVPREPEVAILWSGQHTCTMWRVIGMLKYDTERSRYFTRSWRKHE
jgi:hypothetical protein